MKRSREARDRDPRGKQKRGHAGAAAARPTQGRPPLWKRPLPIVAVLAVVAAAGVYLFMGNRGAPSRDAPPEGGDAQPVERADPNSLIRQINDLSGQGRWVEAVPIARRLASENDQQWRAHYLHAVTLANAVHEEQVAYGRRFPVTRSSRRIVAMLRDALSSLLKAEALTQEPSELIHVHSLLGQLLAVWGFDWNALMEYSTLERLDPAWRGKVAEKEDTRSVVSRLRLADQDARR